MKRYVGDCVDCETGKGCPCDRSGSPGNIQETHPFQFSGDGSYSFFAALAQRENGAVDMGRPVLWICGCEGE